MLKVHSQNAFHKYAEPLGLALHAYPAAVVWNPPGSCETFACRFRDAVKGGLRYGHTSENVPKGLFDAHAGKLIVAIRSNGLDKNFVVIGTKSAIREYDTQQNGSQNTPEVKDNEVHVEIKDTTVAVMLCELIKRQVFKTPVVFVAGPLTQEIATRLENDYGVTLVPVPNRPDYFTLL